MSRFSILKTIMLAVVALAFFGCSGSSTAPAPVEISGRAVKGLVYEGTVSAYAVTSDGQPGVLIDTTTTMSDGSFIVDIASFRGDLYLELVGGYYIDEATGVELPLETALRAVFPDVTPESVLLITPLTELAVMLSPSLKPEDVSASGAVVSQLIGGVDIFRVIPADVTGPVVAATLSQIDYGLALAALSQWVADENLTMGEALLLLANDLADFKIDSTGSELYSALVAFVGSSRNGAGVSLAQTTLDETLEGAIDKMVLAETDDDPAQAEPVVATDDVATTQEDTEAVFSDLLENDTALDQTPLFLIAADSLSAHGGEVTVLSDHTISYAPALNFNGNDTFLYMVTDSEGNSSVAEVSVDVLPVNDLPVATDDLSHLSTYEDEVVISSNLLANDYDIDSDVLTVVAVTTESEAGGSAEYMADGVFRYNPAPDFNGVDYFSYTVSDGNGGTATAVVAVEVLPVMDTPIANADMALTSEDVAVTVGNPLDNDVDADGDELTLTDFDATSLNGGSISLSGGVLTYTPPSEFSGTDTFAYTVSDSINEVVGTVTITVTAVNDAPVAGDDAVVTNEDALLITSNLLLNDSDVDSANLSIIDYERNTGFGGAVTLTTNGSFHYMPAANFNGTDSFTYLVSDSAGLTDTATVTVEVLSVNDEPTATPVSVTLNEDSVDYLIADLLANAEDVDGGVLFLLPEVSTTAKGASYSVISTDVFYTPAPNFNGADEFTCTVSDGQGGTVEIDVSVMVAPVNDVPVANDDPSIALTMEDSSTVTGNVLANDADIDGDQLEVIAWSGISEEGGTVESRSDGTFSYVPATNFNGIDAFSYTVGDGNGAQDVATATVEVIAVNDAPFIDGLSLSTLEDTPLGLSQAQLFLGAGDADDLYDALTLTVDGTTATGGTVAENPDGSYTYTPAANFYGNDFFNTRVSDPSGATAFATVAVAIAPVNDAPVAQSDSVTTYEDRDVTTGSVILNDADDDNDPLSIAGFDNFTAAGSTVEHLGNGVFHYTPAPNWNGGDSFSYTISDGKGGSDTTTVAVSVLSVADVAIVNPDFGNMQEDAPGITIAVLANDLDGDGDLLTIYSFDGSPAGGTVAQVGQALVFTPASNFNGTVEFAYVVSEDGGVTSSAGSVVTVTVTPVNDAPVALDDTFGTAEDAPVVFNILNNDYDVDGGLLTVIATAQETVNGGRLEYHGNGVFTYSPADNFYGDDIFGYTLVDDMGTTSGPATVTINVAMVDDPPVAVDDELLLDEDSPASVALLANDYDPDMETVTLLSFDSTSSAGAVITAAGSGVVIYTPAGNFSGADSFAYTIEDQAGNTASAKVNVTVTEINDAPVAVGDSVAGPEDQPLLIPFVQLNDTDDDGDVLRVLTADPYSANGARVVDNGDGTFLYTSTDNFVGVDSFSYTITDDRLGFSSATVSITITEMNDAPIAAADVINTAEDTPVVGFDLAANDSDLEGDPLTVTSVDFLSAEGAILTLDAAGLLTYTPPGNFFGPDSFSYVVSDDGGATTIGQVAVYVTPVNDIPVALDVNIALEQGEAKTFTVHAVDADGDALLYNSPLASSAGGAVLNHGDGTFTYQPNVNFVGPDLFYVSVDDGRGLIVMVTVNINVAAAANIDSDGDGLSDYMEVNHYSTSPSHADTDGDGLTDGREIIELGFNPLQDNYRFNPLIADLPDIGIDFGSSPQILLVYTTGATQSTSQTTEDSSSTTHSETTEVGVQAEFKFNGFIPTGENKLTVSASRSWTDEQTSQHRDAYETASSSQEDYSGGLLQVTLNIENRGDIAFTIKNLILSAFVPSKTSPGELLPVGNLELDVGTAAFPETTLGPGQLIEGWVFTAEIDLGTTLELLSNSASLVVQPSSYELTDALGRAFNHNLTDVLAKTALVTIDYGFDRPVRNYRVATNLDYYTDPSLYGVTVGQIFGTDSNFLKADLDASTTPLAIVDGLVTPEIPINFIDDKVSYADTDDGAWRFAISADFEGKAFDEIKLNAGDVLSLVYCSDPDKDGLGEREEQLWGTDPTLRDTDNDGLWDITEVRGWEKRDYADTVPMSERIVYYSNPLIADSDHDGLNDGPEHDNIKSTDQKRDSANPYAIDSDGDYIPDNVDTDPTIPSGEFFLTGLSASTAMNNSTGSHVYEVALTWNVANTGTVSNIIILRHEQSGGIVPVPPVPPTAVGDFPSWSGPDSSWARIAQTISPSATSITNSPPAEDRDYVYYAYVQVTINGEEGIYFCQQVAVPFEFTRVLVTLQGIYAEWVHDEGSSFDTLEFFGHMKANNILAGELGSWQAYTMKSGDWYEPTWSTHIFVKEEVGATVTIEFLLGDEDDWGDDDESEYKTYTYTWDSTTGWGIGWIEHDNVGFDTGDDSPPSNSGLDIRYTIDYP